MAGGRRTDREAVGVDRADLFTLGWSRVMVMMTKYQRSSGRTGTQRICPSVGLSD